MPTKSGIISILIMVFAASCLNGQIPDRSSCTLARDQFTAINDRLLRSNGHPGPIDDKAMSVGTDNLEAYVTKVVLGRLVDIGDSSAIRAYLMCMQQRDGVRPWDDLTDGPQVFVQVTQNPPLALSEFLVMRGGNAIPQTHPILQCFARNGTRWKQVGTFADAEKFDGRTLYVHPLASPIPGEEWYLVSGRTIGDTGGRLRVEVVSCSAEQFRTVWTRDEIFHGKIDDVQSGYVTLSYLKQGRPGDPLPVYEQLGPEFIIMNRDPNPDPIRFTETLRVTKNGLEP